jgi:hypothetical protein
MGVLSTKESLMSRKLIAALLSLVLAGMSFAQTGGGQLCVRAYEDRNGNAMQDANEPPITRGISASLGDAQGVIIETAMMENSPNASGGTVCFQRLVAGQYTVRVTSADYNATTPSEFVTAVSDTGVPQVFPFGGQVIPLEVVPETDASGDLNLSAAEQQAFLAKAVFAGIGAVVIMGAMAVVGALIYFFVLRTSPSTKATGQYAAVRATGSHPAVQGQYLAPETGYAKMSDATDMPVSAQRLDDTDKPKTHPSVPANPYAKEDDGFQFEDDPDAPFKPQE